MIKRKTYKALTAGAMSLLLATGMCMPIASFGAFNAPAVAVAAEQGDDERANAEFVFESNNIQLSDMDCYFVDSDSGVKDYSQSGILYLDDYNAQALIKVYYNGTEVKTLDSQEVQHSNGGEPYSPTIDLSDAPAGATITITADRSRGTDENRVYTAVIKRAAEKAQPTCLSLTLPQSLSRAVSDATIADGTEYTAIKVFDADITGAYDGEDAPKASNIAFAQGVSGDVIKGGSEDTRDFSNAQNAAEFIGENIDHQPGVGLESGSYGMELAKRLVAAGADTKTITADGDKVQLDGEGYYLIVRTADLTGENTAATSPIFAALDSGDNTITLKVAIPTIEKQIQEDKTGEFGDEADHTLNQDVNYQLIGTIADNVNAFETYEYNFKDSWDADKLALHADSVKVVVVDAEGTEKVDLTDVATIATDEAGKLAVDFADIKGAVAAKGTEEAPLALVNTDKVVVSYTAEQCGTTASPEGIQNDAYLEYSNNPIMTSKGQTPVVSVKDYSYALRIHKTDNATGEDLAGVEFSIKNAEGKYLGVNEAGEVIEQDEAYSFITDEEGRIMIDGVDADDYTIAETKALDSYEMLESEITVAVNAADRDAVVGSVASTSELVSADEDAADASEVVAQVLVKNVKEIPLPSTGEMGVALIIFLAVAAGIYGVSRRKKQEAYRVMSV